jgi:hypothetical protein
VCGCELRVGVVMRPLAFVLLCVASGCTKKPDPMVMEVAKLKAQVAQLQMAVKMQDAWNVKQSAELVAVKSFGEHNRDISLVLLTEVVDIHKAVAKPKSGAYVDCWTDRQGYRNCTDANGNTSRRNF